MKQTVTKRALTYLKTQQRDDGSFVSLASSSKTDFSTAHPLPAIFTSALLLECLHTVPGSLGVRQLLARYLLKQKSQHWTWNYLERDQSPDALSSRYPDDLDDTACTLGALTNYSSNHITGDVLAFFAQALISTEQRVGGPYNTWLIDTKRWPVWQDVDLAVNANIGWFLSLHGVIVPGLTKYIDDTLADHKLRSSYYIGQAPLFYFLARWYNGAQVALLRNEVTNALHSSPAKKSALEQALLLHAATMLSLPTEILIPTYESLLSLQNQDGSWDANALYTEPLEAGIQQYAGSASLTTGFVLQALHAHEHSIATTTQAIKPPRTQHSDPIIKPVLPSVNNVGGAELQGQYKKYSDAVIKQDKGGQITQMASITLAACQQKLPQATVDNLNRASLNGWIAYSIYDDVLDEEAKPIQLGAANYAARETVRCFEAALPGDAQFSEHVLTNLTQMDAANTWEITHTRAAIKGKQISIAQLPDYKNFELLWQRSIGHALTASAVLKAQGHPLDSTEQQMLREFFQNFLIARQLNDDAHDWEDDLANGHMSAVITLLLQERAHTNIKMIIDISSDLPALRQEFWRTTITQVDTLIQVHIAKARAALIACPIITQPNVFLSWLDALSSASTLAIQEKSKAEQFIAEFLK